MMKSGIKYNFKLYPIVQSVAKIFCQVCQLKDLGVFATRATINSNVYPREIAKYNTKMQVFWSTLP